MQDYVKSSIAILNDTTKELNNLNQLGIYLSKQININALKTLKLIILASETNKLNKPFDINYVGTYIESIDIKTSEVYKQKENIAGNLAMNPQNFALELFEYIIKNYHINLNFKCYGIYSIFDVWNNSLRRMEYDERDIFYKRYDMINKKLDIFEFLIYNGLLTKRQLDELVNNYAIVVDEDRYLTNEQKQKIGQMIIDLIKSKNEHKYISSIKNISKEQRDKYHDQVDRIMGISRKPNLEIYSNCKNNAKEELKKYKMENDQCAYIINEIPRLIKQKTIK
mgnify:CR=1 FL=1